MSTTKHPVGPQASAVYRRRRLVVGLGLLAVLLIIVLIFVRPGSGSDPAATPAPAATGNATDPAAGTHRIIVQDASGAVIGWTEITVSGAGTTATGLANTGLEAGPWLAGGLLMLVLGGALLQRRRRVSMES